MKYPIGKIFSQQNRRLLLLPIALLNLFPVLISAISHPQDLSILLPFLAALALVVALFTFWLARKQAEWAKLAASMMGGAMTIWYVAFFDQQFSSAYLASLIYVQLIFLYFGLRYGAAALALVVLADAFHLITDVHADLASNIYVVIVETTIALVTWIFMSSANEMRDEALDAKEDAQRLAAEAVASQQEAQASRQEAERAREEAQRLADEISRLNRLLLDSHDNERRKLARDIHDGPLQGAGVELLTLERIKRRLEAGDNERAITELGLLNDIARQNISDLRSAIDGLHNTLLDSGIELALKNLARKTAQDAGIPIEAIVALRPDLAQTLPQPLVNCIYELCVEALSNVRKHAEAHNVAINLSGTADEIFLAISDDGQGFDYEFFLKNNSGENRQIGLYTMTERAKKNGGTMTVASRPGSGTTVSFAFPVGGPTAVKGDPAATDLCAASV